MYCDVMSNPPRDRHIPDVVSLNEAKDILGVSKAAAHKMVVNGRLVGAQAGSTWIFRRVVVERLRDGRAEVEQ